MSVVKVVVRAVKAELLSESSLFYCAVFSLWLVAAIVWAGDHNSSTESSDGTTPLSLHCLLQQEKAEQPLIHLGTYLARTTADADRIIEQGKGEFLHHQEVLVSLLDQYGQHPTRWSRLLTLNTVWHDLHRRAEQKEEPAITLLAAMGCPSAGPHSGVDKAGAASPFWRLQQWWRSPSKQSRLSRLLHEGESVETTEYLASVADLIASPQAEDLTGEEPSTAASLSSGSSWAARGLAGLLLLGWGVGGMASLCEQSLCDSWKAAYPPLANESCFDINRTVCSLGSDGRRSYPCSGVGLELYAFDRNVSELCMDYYFEAVAVRPKADWDQCNERIVPINYGGIRCLQSGSSHSALCARTTFFDQQRSAGLGNLTALQLPRCEQTGWNPRCPRETERFARVISADKCILDATTTRRADELCCDPIAGHKGLWCCGPTLYFSPCVIALGHSPTLTCRTVSAGYISQDCSNDTTTSDPTALTLVAPSCSTITWSPPVFRDDSVDSVREGGTAYGGYAENEILLHALFSAFAFGGCCVCGGIPLAMVCVRCVRDHRQRKKALSTAKPSQRLAHIPTARLAESPLTRKPLDVKSQAVP